MEKEILRFLRLWVPRSLIFIGFISVMAFPNFIGGMLVLVFGLHFSHEVWHQNQKQKFDEKAKQLAESMMNAILREKEK